MAGLAALCVAVPLVNDGEISGVYLAMLVLVSVASFEVVQGLPHAVQRLEETRPAAQRVFEVVDTPLPSNVVLSSSVPCDFGLEMRNVRFSYTPGSRQVLRDLCLTIASGTKLAVRGESGCGKTSLVNLLLRFWPYQAGRVAFGGHELTEYDPEDLRRYLSVVPQDIHLFTGTIRDNLQVANAEAGQDQMEAACECAALTGFIRAAPAGFETMVGENGLLLSGGERQRLAIARMLLKDAPFVILDEPTAHLDDQTESQIVANLRRALEGKTALIISHRPAVCALADEVVDMAARRVSASRSLVSC
jgi:ATP-binding cassette subfamily C protein CydC